MLRQENGFSNNAIESVIETVPTEPSIGVTTILLYSHLALLLYFLFGGSTLNRVVDSYRNSLTLFGIGFIGCWFLTGHTPLSPETHQTFSLSLALFPLLFPALQLMQLVVGGFRDRMRQASDDRRFRREQKRQAQADANRERQNAIRRERQELEQQRERQLSLVDAQQKELTSNLHAKVLRKVTMQVNLVYKQLQAKLPASVRDADFEKLKQEHLNEHHSIEELQANTELVTALLKRLHGEQLVQELKQQEAAEQTSQSVDYHDMETAILFFKERESQINELPIDDDDKERLIFALYEKREQVLDGYL